MPQRIVCPYFRRNDDECDVGSGYISPHDVQVISRFCSAQYQECLKFRQLTEKHEGRPAAAVSPAAAPRLQPLPGTPTFKEATMPAHSAYLIDEDAHDGMAVPSSLGMLILGLTMLVLSLNGAGLFPLSTIVLGMAIMYGGVGLILIGILDWRRGHAFASAAFTSFGLFWLSKIAMEILPRTGFGQSPSSAALGGYAAMWSMFAFMLFLGSLRLSKAVAVVFGALFLQLLLQTCAHTGFGPVFHIFAAWAGIFGGFAGLYAAAAQGFNKAYGRSVVPVGEVRRI